MQDNTWVKYDLIDKNIGVFEVQPLDKGLGVTLGNALRRVLLSSLSGSGMIGLSVKGASHEFSTLPNVVEDVLEIICNLKEVIFMNKTNDVQIATIKLSDKKNVVASDIVCPEGLSVVNKNHYLFEITGKSNIDIQIHIANGVGYTDVSAQQKKSPDKELEFIYTDTSFSPIINVNHVVDQIRVGKELDNDKLTLTVETNGTVAPDEAVKKAVQIFGNHLKLFSSINQKPEIDNSEEQEIEDLRKQSILKMSIDELELSARSSNCLKRASITTVSQLLEKDMSELNKIKNFGSKSADEINEKLSQYGVSLSQSEDADLQVTV